MSQAPRTIRALLLDVEGVIAHPNEARADELLDALRPGLRRSEVQRHRDGAALKPVWAAYSVGAIDSSNYWSQVLASLGLPEQGPTLEAMLALQAETGWGHIDDAVLGFARDIANAHELRLGILSNSSSDHEHWIPKMVAGFDALRFSHRVGARKPDDAAFVGAIEALGVPAPSVFFVDDKPRNIEAAKKLGLQTFTFTGLDDLRVALSALGLVERDHRIAPAASLEHES
jgi:putative hydrolase of the HAD superfamily